MSGVQNPYAFQYETIAASQTGQVLGGTGAKGDYLERLLVQSITPATASVTLIDGSTSIVLLTGAAALSTGNITLTIGCASASGAWSVTTGAGCTVLAIGIFSK